MTGKTERKKIFFVGAGSGDPELITLKGRRLLNEADLIVYAGSLVNPALLDGVKAEIHDSAAMDLNTIMEIMVSAVRAGQNVVRLHTGDPAIYGAIGEQMDWLDREEIAYEVVPGVTSALAAAAALGVELTVPEITQTVIFTRQAGKTPVPEQESLIKLASIQASMCIFLSVSMMETVIENLLAGGYPENTPVAVVEKASWPEEQIVRGALADITEKVKESAIQKTAMILVGKALGNECSPLSKLYDGSFSHEYRQGKP